MKAKIIITPKKAVLDPQGKTVQTALEHMGYTGVTGVHIGKYRFKTEQGNHFGCCDKRKRRGNDFISRFQAQPH